MRSRYIVIAAALSICAASAICYADEPTQPATAPAQPAAQQPPSASTEAAAKTEAKDTATASNKDDDTDAQEKHLLARGYKKEMRNGVAMYCRKEIKTGSHFETKQCGTAASMDLAEQQGRELMNSMKNQGGSRVN
jgi:hypothetical protein